MELGVINILKESTKQQKKLAGHCSVTEQLVGSCVEERGTTWYNTLTNWPTVSEIETYSHTGEIRGHLTTVHKMSRRHSNLACVSLCMDDTKASTYAKGCAQLKTNKTVFVRTHYTIS